MEAVSARLFRAPEWVRCWGWVALKKCRLWKEKIKEIKDIVARVRLEGHEGFFHLTLDCVGFLYR